MKKKEKTLLFSSKLIITLLVLIISLLGLLYLFFNQSAEEELYYLQTGYHTHADFKIVLNGKTLNFSDEKYMEQADYIHLHDNDGGVVHYHEPNLTFSTFLSTLNISLTETCIQVENESFCTDENHEVAFYVNQTKISPFIDYVPEDLDRILLVYSEKGEDLEAYFSQITNDSCVYSEKCPERGPAPPESCSGDSCAIDFALLNK